MIALLMTALLMITLLGEIDEDILKSLSGDENAYFLERILALLEWPTQFEIYFHQSFQVKVFILHTVANFLNLVSNTDKFKNDQTTMLQNLIVASTNIVQSEDIRLNRLTEQKRSYISETAGDIRKNVTNNVVIVFNVVPQEILVNAILSSNSEDTNIIKIWRSIYVFLELCK